MDNVQLVVIIGVPSAGKSTLIKRIIDHQDSGILDLLNIKTIEEIKYFYAKKFFQSPEIISGNVLLHYDIVDRFIDGKFEFINDYIKNYKNPVFVVLSCTKNRLFSRIRNRYLLRLKSAVSKTFFKRKKNEFIPDSYPNSYSDIRTKTENYEKIFQKFIKTLNDMNKSYILIDSSDYNYRVIDDL